MSYDDLDRYDGNTEHDMWVDYTYHEYTSNSNYNHKHIKSDYSRRKKTDSRKSLNNVEKLKSRKKKYSYLIPIFVGIFLFGLLVLFLIPSKKQRIHDLIDAKYYYPNYGQVTDFFTGKPCEGAFYIAIVEPTKNNPLTDPVIWELAQQISYLDRTIYDQECRVASYLANRYPVDYIPMEERYPVARRMEERIDLTRQERDSLFNCIKYRYLHDFHPQDVIVVQNSFRFMTTRPIERHFYYINNEADSILWDLRTSNYSNPIPIISKATGVQFTDDVIYSNMSDHIMPWR